MLLSAQVSYFIMDNNVKWLIVTSADREVQKAWAFAARGPGGRLSPKKLLYISDKLLAFGGFWML